MSCVQESYQVGCRSERCEVPGCADEDTWSPCGDVTHASQIPSRERLPVGHRQWGRQATSAVSPRGVTVSGGHTGALTRGISRTPCRGEQTPLGCPSGDGCPPPSCASPQGSQPMAARDQSHLAVLTVWKRLGPCLTLVTSTEAPSPNTAKHSRESGPPARQLREDANIQFMTAREGDFLPGAGSTLSSARVTGFLGGSNDTDVKKFYELLGTVQRATKKD